MILTKLKSVHPGGFEYVNLEHISYVDFAEGHFVVCLNNGHLVEVDGTDPVLIALMSV